jgi:hypothetical protein
MTPRLIILLVGSDKKVGIKPNVSLGWETITLPMRRA